MSDHKSTMIVAVNYILDQHPELINLFINKHKLEISNKIKDMHNSTVAYGPFKGLRFTNDTHWGGSDKGAMILGIYEQEILKEISNLPKKYDIFIDLGAADGYYGIGVLVNKLFKKSYCFEITENGREVINKNAYLNDVLNNVVIKGEATKNFSAEIPVEEINNSVLFVDIEGGEFNLFDPSLFEIFHKSIIFIEIHDFLIENGSSLFDNLIDFSSKTHLCKKIKMGSRDLSGYEEIKNWNDTDRWMLCSESRAQLMTWVRFDPLVME